MDHVLLHCETAGGECLIQPSQMAWVMTRSAVDLFNSWRRLRDCPLIAALWKMGTYFHYMVLLVENE